VLVLGLNAHHADAAACLLRDGRPVAAAEEERFRRVKHWAGFPSEAVRYCLREARATLDDVDVVAINQDTRANSARRVRYLLTSRPDPRLLFNRVRNRSKRAGIADEIEAACGARLRAPVRRVEHHLAHLASAFHVSPFEEAVAVSLDGFGDFASAAWGPGAGNALRVDGRVFFPHSLGTFYEALTQFLGFRNYGDEYKVMGLAPYGTPARVADVRRLVELRPDGTYRLALTYFRHHRGGAVHSWQGAPQSAVLFSDRLAALLGPPREPGAPLTQHHKDVAFAAQAVYEEACFHLLARLHERYGMSNLALAGGCGMNSVANGRLYARTPFTRLFVQPAAGDGGGALGAALVAWHDVAGAKAARGFVMTDAGLGPGFDDGEIGALLDARAGELAAAGCTVSRADDEDARCGEVADAIARGEVTGWFQGRMEWGPRALGNRSILGDPRRADMKDILNRKIKRRESFRPFAPSVLREAVPAWFEIDDDVPFMTAVFPIREERRRLVPAVTHVDGSGRLQTVARESQPLYWALIAAFEARTGVPMVLNTSFNENEPIVCRPEEALDCFLRTRMDLLALGPFLVRRC
jgi:carbamoyltransferase